MHLDANELSSDFEIFVISLKESSIRQNFIEKQLNDLNLNFSFFPAINGRTLNPEEISNLVDQNAVLKNPSWLTPGAIGCALSHLGVYKKMVEMKISTALVLEDDVKISPHLPQILKNLKPKIQSDEIIMLYFESWNECRFSTFKSEKIINDFKLFFPLELNFISGAAYIVPLQVAENLTRIILPIRVTSDSWKFFFEAGAFTRIRCIFPTPVFSALFGSEIGYIENPLFKKIARLINEKNIPPFSWFLKWRREWLHRKLHRCSFHDVPSKYV